MRLRLGFAARVGLVAVLVVVATGCDWTTFHYGPARTGYDPFETKIGVGNVASLSTAWTATANGGLSTSPVVANGLVYESGAVLPTNQHFGFHAFSAAGSTNCSGAPKSCAPVWRAKALCLTGCNSPAGTAFSEPTVVNGVVFVGDSDGNLYAFDAAGSTNCSGAPKTCTPLWTAATGTPGIYTSPAVVSGVVYVSVDDGNLYAFDAAGSTNCSGSPKTCLPLWTAAIGARGHGESSPAVANGVVYVGGNDLSGGHLDAFDAAGVTGCSGTPETCLPLWSGSIPSEFSSPAVANGVVYIGSGTGTIDGPGELDAFDAAGVTGCSGTPKTCLPLWTAAAGGVLLSSPAVANGVVYIGSADHKLYTFDAAGDTGCSGTPKTCLPLWTAATGGVLFSSPAVANGVVYIGSWDDNVYAFDAAGSTNCSGTPITCSPLWTSATGSSIGSSPAVANGVVYVVGGDSKLYAYSLGS